VLIVSLTKSIAKLATPAFLSLQTSKTLPQEYNNAIPALFSGVLCAKLLIQAQLAPHKSA